MSNRRYKTELDEKAPSLEDIVEDILISLHTVRPDIFWRLICKMI